jgi:glucosylceramidase
MSIKSAAARPLMLLSALAFISISFISFGKPAMAASTGAITNANGMCLDNKNNSSTNNNLVQLWTCTGGASQQWTVQGDGTIRINGKCLDTVNHSTSMGTQLAIFTCGSYSTQKWTYAATGFAKLQSQAQNKFCADNDNNRAVNGNKVTNYGCWNTPAQQWRMPQAVAATPPRLA